MTFYPITPKAAPRLTRRDRWKKRPVVVSYYAFRDEVRGSAMAVPIPSKVIFWMPMPSTWSGKKRREMANTPHLVRPDLSNMLKALEDAVWGEDAIVWSIWPEKRWSATPGIEVLPI
jgi:Holliday junction resolvase RusA-like endonuclease